MSEQTAPAKAKKGELTTEWTGTVATALAAVVAALNSPNVQVQVTALWVLAVVVGTYNLARGLTKLLK